MHALSSHGNWRRPIHQRQAAWGEIGGGKVRRPNPMLRLDNEAPVTN